MALRFYEPKSQATAVQSILKNNNNPIGPVHTNYLSTSKTKPKLIIICESPSYAEVAAISPTVCSTGKKIYNHLVKSKMIDPKLIHATSYCFHTHYSDFFNNQIYITNMVRYQANFNTKGITVQKNSNVKKIWKIN